MKLIYKTILITIFILSALDSFGKIWPAENHFNVVAGYTFREIDLLPIQGKAQHRGIDISCPAGTSLGQVFNESLCSGGLGPGLL